jgi:hypothetical protein
MAHDGAGTGAAVAATSAALEVIHCLGAAHGLIMSFQSTS